MKITYRLLWLRIIVMADKPQMTWPMMPVGVLFTKDGDPAIDNSFIQFSSQTIPPLPVMLIFVTQHIGTDFCLPGKRLDDLDVHLLNRNEYRLDEPKEMELPDDITNVRKEVFRVLVRENGHHRGRQHLFRIRYCLEQPHEPPITTCYG